MKTWKVGLPLVLSSGACALVYETTWLREFRLLFGASTLASATVLALFIAGVGLGSRVLGPRADRHEDPLLLYLLLEAGIAVLAALSPLLLAGARFVYLGLGGSTTLGSAGATLVRLLLAAPILLPPTFLMGGTLPALARAVESRDRPGRPYLALYYGTNTLGAVLGASLTTFSLLETFGNRRTIWLACALNLAIVALGLLLRRVLGLVPSSAVESGSDTASGEGTLAARDTDAPDLSSGATRLVLLLSAASGFVFFLMELVYYRMLGPILGGSVFTLGLILTVALFGVGLGGLAYAARGALFRARLSALSFTFFAQGVGLMLPYVLGDRVALFAAHSQPDSGGDFTARVVAWGWVAALVVLPSALVAGFQFPLFVALLGRGQKDVGKNTGDAYAWNTAGAVLGSLLGGFGLLSWLGAPGTWRLACLLLLCLSVVTAFFVPAREAKGLGLRQLGLGLVAAIVLFFAQGPTAAWRHSGIGVGRFSPQQLETKNGTRDFLHRHRRALLWDRDGLESSVALMSHQGLVFVVNGKIDGHSTLDAPTAVMSGLLGALLHGHAQTSLVIGLGTGSTAGWLARIPSMKSVDVFELESAILEVARDCGVVNLGAMENPRLDVHIGDGRELLLTSKKKYDVIFSEPSNPYRAGIASLFTREFYQAIKKRLNPGGVFLQWVQVYEVDREAIDLVYATLGSEFPHIESWRTHRDLLLIATEKPLSYDAANLRELIATEPYKKGLLASWKVAELEGLFARYVAGPDYAWQVASKHRGALNTDDRNLLEFGFARSVNRHDLFSMQAALAASKAKGFDRPRVASDLDWQTVEDARALLYGQTSKGQPARGDPLGFYALLFDRVLKGAASGRPIPPVMQGRMAEIAPEGAQVLAAAVAYRAHDTERAVELLSSSFERLQEDPWPDADLMFVGLRMLGHIGVQHREFAERILDLLKEPFAARVLDEQRIDVGFQIAAHHGLGAECASWLGQFEPWIPWRQSLLEKRVACYELAQSPRLSRARAELAEFLAAQEPDKAPATAR